MWELDYKENLAPKFDAFELWCWRRLLRVPWTARRSNQSILKEISPGCSLDGLMLKLKLQYFGHLIWRADSFEKTLMLGKIEGRSKRGRWDGWMASPTQWKWVWVNSGSWWRTERPGMLQFMRSQRVRHDWATELNWKVKNYVLCGTLLRTLAWERQHLRLVWGTVPEKKDVGVCRHFCWRQMDMKSNIKRLLLVTHMHKTQALSS